MSCIAWRVSRSKNAEDILEIRLRKWLKTRIIKHIIWEKSHCKKECFFVLFCRVWEGVFKYESKWYFTSGKQFTVKIWNRMFLKKCVWMDWFSAGKWSDFLADPAVGTDQLWRFSLSVILDVCGKSVFYFPGRTDRGRTSDPWGMWSSEPGH